MKLDRFTSCQTFMIKQPRWHDRTVLLAKYKAGTHNAIKFTQVKAMKDVYYISGEKLKSYPVNTNGKLDCYVVPINDLEVLERD